MNLKWSISSQPVNDPVTTAEVKSSLRIDHSVQDTMLASMIKAATRQAEKDLDRSIINRTLELKFDYWPTCGEIHLPKPPFQSVSSVAYIDTNGDSQTLVEDTDYEVKLSGDSGRVVVAPGKSWPSVKSDKKEVITVTLVAGYGALADNVPDDIKQAIIAKVDIMYSKGEIGEDTYNMLIENTKHYFDYHIND